MGKKYFDTKKDTLESSILSVWQEAAKKNEDKLKRSRQQPTVSYEKTVDI